MNKKKIGGMDFLLQVLIFLRKIMKKTFICTTESVKKLKIS
jgi:hypothetical protein